MPLANGTRIGPYEVLSQLGEGGMGEVYRGRDSNLGREVALKVLPESLATDAEYIARFQREAQLLASLNHPNIAAIYGLEGRAIVMELVEGPTLADRIAQGPIPLDESVAIARQIADALEYAHEKAVIHRDLKPANVKVTPEGVVKVLDFGLAKIAEAPSPHGNPASSPTLTVRAATQAGLILGTASYMAPEQARAQNADRRADIWAFGAVLYEMLSGKMAFPGDNITDILASVVKLEPEWNDLPPSTPPAIRKLVTRCLAKDRKRRLQAIGEARLAIEDYLADPIGPAATAPITPVYAEPPRRKLPWVVAAALFVALAALAIVHFRETAPLERVLRYSIAAPEKSTIHTFAVSPNGRYVAIAAARDGRRRLWLRPLDSLAAQELSGTEDATYPFWSPDSRSIGFFGGGKLKRTSIGGDPPQILCNAIDGRGGAWSRDGVIVFAPSGEGGLYRVAAVGGEPVALTKVTGREIHRFPVFLPDGRRFLYLASRYNETTGIWLTSLDTPSPRRLLADNSNPLWWHVPGAGVGHLLFHRDQVLMAQPLDAKTLQPAGDLFPIAQPVSLSNVNYGQFSISPDGVLVYWSGGGSLDSQLAWYDRSGKILNRLGPPGRAHGLALSPDEKTAAVARGQRTSPDIWLYELVRGVDTRFTFTLEADFTPVWSPDGSRIVYSSGLNSRSVNLFLKETTNTKKEEPLLKEGKNRFAADWSKDGRTILYVESANGYDLWTLNVDGDRKPVALVDSQFNEVQGQFSPDGRWVAYASDESGRYEIYVRPFPSSAGKWKISINGGELPRWSRDGRELFFLNLEGHLMSAAVKALPGGKPEFSAETPQLLFEGRILRGPQGFNNFHYAVSADGKRILALTHLGESTETPLTVIVNWLAAVRK